jgi:carbamoyltransferase
MRILALQFSHHASIAIIENGEIDLFIEESRLSKVKYDDNLLNIFSKIKKNKFDVIAYTHCNLTLKRQSVFNENLINFLKDYEIEYDQLIPYFFHHHTHAFSAFYNSNFNKAVCLVIDNGGTDLEVEGQKFGLEIVSILKFNYEEEKLKMEEVFKICQNREGKTLNKFDKMFSLPTISLGGMYEFFKILFKIKEPGAVMALSCYGKQNTLPICFSFNKNLFISNPIFLYKVMINSQKKMKEACYILQKQTTEIILHYIDYIAKNYPNYPICLSGGVFQNCMINFEIIKKHKNIFVDPVSHDGGTALGLAQHIYFEKTKKKPIPYKNIFLGFKYDYSDLVLKLLNNDIIVEKLFFKKTNITEVAELLKENNVVAIFQGRSESGPRALGNRSILFNPSDMHGKDKINIIKNREWFRPYAGTVLDEHKKNWFNFYNKENTEFMSYAVEVKKEKRNLIPAITHIDGSCRVQTLKKEDNEHFYNLIEEFYKITNVPILLNTSLNLAGKPLVEDFDDLIEILKISEINYGYLPEYNLLIYK